MDDRSGITRIICKSCNHVLREGIQGSKVEKKLCQKCVQKSHKAADPNRIKKVPTGSDFVEGLLEKERKKKELKETKEALEMNLPVEIESSIVIQGKEALFAMNFTIAKVKKFDVALSKKQLQAFIEDIERVEEQESLNN